MAKKKALISFPEDILQKLDEYAEREFTGNRSMAIYRILKQFFEDSDKEG